MTEKLPGSWCVAPLSELAEINPGIDKTRFQDSDEVPFVPMPAVEAGTGRMDVSGRRPFGEVKSGFTPFASGDVLFAKITPCMENGKMAVVPDLPHGVGFGSTEFFVLRPTAAIDAKLLYYFVSSAAFRQEAQHHMTGAVGQKRVPKRYLETKPSPLPPINEQRRIVEKIETLFAELDKGEEYLRQVQTLLARYRQSVLKAAVNIESRVWQQICLADLLVDIRYGTAKKCRPDGKGVAVLRIPNVVSGRIDLRDLKFAELSDKELAKLSLRNGDLLLVRSNGSANLVGRSAVVTNEAEGMAFAGYLIRLRVDQNRLLPAYLKLVLDAPQTRRRIERQARSTSGVHNINSDEVKAISFELPPLSVQREIVEKTSAHLNQVRLLEEACRLEFSRSAALRQSILTAAFSGKLVPQNRNDEPASELLARIRAQRAGQPPKASRRTATA